MNLTKVHNQKYYHLAQSLHKCMYLFQSHIFTNNCKKGVTMLSASIISCHILGGEYTRYIYIEKNHSYINF